MFDIVHLKKISKKYDKNKIIDRLMYCVKFCGTL